MAEAKALGSEGVLSWNPTSIIILSFNKPLWNTYYEPGTVLRVGGPGKQGRHQAPKSLVTPKSIPVYLNSVINVRCNDSTGKANLDQGLGKAALRK